MCVYVTEYLYFREAGLFLAQAHTLHLKSVGMGAIRITTLQQLIPLYWYSTTSLYFRTPAVTFAMFHCFVFKTSYKYPQRIQKLHFNSMVATPYTTTTAAAQAERTSQYLMFKLREKITEQHFHRPFQVQNSL